MTVLLPVPGGPSPDERVSGAALPSLSGRLSNVRILVVDDEYDARELLATVLETAGATVTLVASAGEALDFLAKRPSTSLGSVTPSYRPGVTPTDLSECLPDFVVEAMREAIPVFGRQIAGYDHPDVVMTGVETRTSSPVRFTRGEDGHSLNTYGLYPAGEGAGYAGGILSAAVDGIKTAEAVARSIGTP